MTEQKLIPLFPLQIVVFPREELNLHIFEPRYRQLILECKQEDILFGIPYHSDDTELLYGCSVRLKEISKVYPDGKMDIKTVGIGPIEIIKYLKQYPNRLYPGGYVEELEWDADGEIELYERIKQQITDLYNFMNIKTLPEAFERSFITFEIAHKAGLSKEQEYELLQIPYEQERQLYLINHLEEMIPKVKAMEELRKKVQLNGHFKHIIPPKV